MELVLTNPFGAFFFEIDFFAKKIYFKKKSSAPAYSQGWGLKARIQAFLHPCDNGGSKSSLAVNPDLGVFGFNPCDSGNCSKRANLFSKKRLWKKFQSL
jgi:hypothetical protein